MAALHLCFSPRETGLDEITVDVFEGGREAGSLVFSHATWIKLGTVLIRSNVIVQNWHAEILPLLRRGEPVRQAKGGP